MTGFRSTLLGAVSTLAVLAGSSAALAQVAEVVVTGEFIPDERRVTSEISNVLTVEQLAITGDSVIADSLVRVTGLSIQRGGFIVVRGLNERYSSAILNGSAIPSPEPLQEVVPLDIFPNNFIESALVQKTYSPQYAGDFGGGIVELRSTGVPDEEFFKIGTSLGYNSVSTFESGIRQAGNDYDWTGFDHDDRGIPDSIDGVSLSGLTPEAREAAGEDIRNRWSLFEVDNDQPIWSGSFSYGNSFPLGDSGARLGVLIGGDYGNTWTNRDGARRTTSFGGTEVVLRDDFSPEGCNGFSLDGCGVRNTTNDIELNGLFSVGLEFDPSNTVTFNTIILRSTTRDGLIQQGFLNEQAQILQRTRSQWIERQAWMNQLTGSHLVEIFPGDSGLDITTIDWRGSYSIANRDANDQKDFGYFWDEDDKVFRISTTEDFSNAIAFGELEDTTWDLGLDIAQPFTVGEILTIFNFGAAMSKTERESDFQRFYFQNAPGFVLNSALREQIPEIIYGTTNIDPLGFRLTNGSDAAEQFNASIETIGYYGQLDAQLTPTVRVAAGVRYEDGEQISDSFARQPISCGEIPADQAPPQCTGNNPGANAFQTGDPIHIELQEDHFLPAATATWEFIPNHQLRLAFSKTINRPSLRELTTSPFLDPDRAELISGNPFLTIAELTNYDARWEWYMDNGNFFSLGGFYKDIKDPIEQTFEQIGADTFRRTFLNADKAQLYGVEAEFEVGVPLADWVEALGSRDFFLRGNGAYIFSDVTVPPGSILTDTSRRLQGQSEWLANVQFGFRDDIRGETAVLLVNYTGDRIETVGINDLPNTIEEVPLLVDFNYTKEFGVANSADNTYEFSFRVRNILGERARIHQGPIEIENFELGTTFTVGLSATY